MNKHSYAVTVLGAGLAGCESSLQLAKKGFAVTLIDMKPELLNEEVYKQETPAELVCSNSLKSESPSTASFLLKEELRFAGCKLLAMADKVSVPAGASLAVDREKYSKLILEHIENTSNISFVEQKRISSVNELKDQYPADFYIIATGPLTDETLMASITPEHGYFYDAIAPLVSLESLDQSKMFWGSRYDKGDPDFLNIPMTKAFYETFVDALLDAEKLPYNNMEKPKFFERCMPIEVLAQRGRQTLAFGPFRPVGFFIEEYRPAAILQMRAENKEKTVFNLVGCQTRMKYFEQKRVFSMLPGMEHAEFLRYGSVHRNSFINAPKLLNIDFSLKNDQTVFIAGQLSGVEGYVESIWSGFFAAYHIYQRVRGNEVTLPPVETMSGGILRKMREESDNFQPVNANFSLISNPNKLKKRERKKFYVTSGKEYFSKYWVNFSE